MSARHLVDPAYMGTDGPPLVVQAKAIRPCHVKRLAIVAAKWDFVARYAGRRTPAWMAKRLGMTETAVVRFMWRHGVCPTTRDDLLVSSSVADLLGCTQQWVVRLIKAGKLRGWRNPGGVWWLVPRSEVEHFLKQEGRRTDDVRLREASGWPGVRLGRIRKVKRERNKKGERDDGTSIETNGSG